MRPVSRIHFLTGKEIKDDDGLPKKLGQPCFRKVKNIIEFLSVTGITFFTGIVDWKSSYERVRGSRLVGESPSSSQEAEKTSLNRENIECSQCSDVPFC